MIPLARVWPADPTPDADLIRRYLADRDPAAFELLVRRYAAGVWAVCRGAARDHHAAEDAFQAAFLALARRAGAIRGPVGGWLHRVAYHAALKTRRAADVSPLLSDPQQRTYVRRSPDELALLHAELSSLPDRYRLPILLCDLDELTHTEAANRLGWPVGTVSGRLFRGRAELRRRLERHGVTTALVAATVPAGLISTAVGGSATPAAVSLADGVLLAMRIAKLKLIGAVAAGVVVLAGGLTVGLGQEKKAGDGPIKGKFDPTTAVKPAELPTVAAWNPKTNPCPRFEGKAVIPTAADPVKLAAVMRLRDLLRTLELNRQMIEGGTWPPATLLNVMQVHRNVLDAARDVYGPSPELVEWHREYLAVTASLEGLIKARLEAGTVAAQDYYQVSAEKYYAMYLWLKLKGEVEKK